MSMLEYDEGLVNLVADNVGQAIVEEISELIATEAKRVVQEREKEIKILLHTIIEHVIEQLKVPEPDPTETDVAA